LNGLDAHAAQSTWHPPLNFIADAMAQQRGAQRREHRNPARTRVRLAGEYDRQLATLTTHQVQNTNAGVNGDHIRRQVFRIGDAGTLELRCQLVKVLLITRYSRSRGDQLSQSRCIGSTDDNGTISHGRLLEKRRSRPRSFD